MAIGYFNDNIIFNEEIGGTADADHTTKVSGKKLSGFYGCFWPFEAVNTFGPGVRVN
jgi:hypothetical protein